jgi:acyl-coenzyme A synthetase/AMP-(fatty) acid ligase
LEDLAGGSTLGGRLEALRGRSVLLAMRDQLSAAMAMIELDGVARRMVLCTPDVPAEHIPGVMRRAEVDAVVSDRSEPGPEMTGAEVFVTCTQAPMPTKVDRRGELFTEWILLTSGTTGAPKLVQHTLATLSGAIKPAAAQATPPVWSTFYDIRRYGGLQILLRALLGGVSLVLSQAGEATSDFLGRAAANGVTHILGTPTHWWLALTSGSFRGLSPRYVRLSGEAADQAVLDRLRASFPGVPVVHAFASTEAGVAFEVTDGLAGFPASLVGHGGAEVEMKVEEGTLRIRSARIAARYLGDADGPLVGTDGFVDTRDLVELRGERYYFAGRKDGVINVGGQKIHPEEVEAVINAHPRVRMSVVRARKNPITGAIVVAEIVLEGKEPGGPELKQEILERCRQALPRHKVPAVVQFVQSLAMTSTGKIARRNA